MTQPNLMFAKYRLLARLASGGMADVFLAASGFAAGASKLLVLKVLRHDLPEEERASFVQMFEDEGRLAMRLNHPSIVQSYEVGSEDGQSFIAMEYLEGQPLSLIQERGFASPACEVTLEMQLCVLCQVLEGLEYAHTLTGYDGRALDIVHRDVSPQNVFVTYAGHAKLVDFGIAKTLESNSKTAAGVVKGKVPYLSPEQVKGARVDRRADLFSVGVMLWEAVARRSMHGDATLYEILRRLVSGDLPRLRDAVPDVDRSLEQVVARALALDPADRHPSAAALRDELNAFLARRPKVDPRALGACVARHFERERQSIAELIRKEMQGTASGAHDSAPVNAAELVAALPLLPTRPARPGAPGPVTEPMRVPAPGEAPPRSSPAAATPAVAVRVAPTASMRAAVARRWPRWVAVLAGLAGLALWLAQGTRAPAPPPAMQASISASAAPGPDEHLDAAGGTHGEPRSVSLRVRAYPEHARLVLDAEALPDNPYQGQRPADARPHTLEVSAPGHLARRIELQLDHDLDLEVRLAEAPGAALPATHQAAPERAPSPPRAPSRGRPPLRDDDELYPDLPALAGPAALGAPGRSW